MVKNLALVTDILIKKLYKLKKDLKFLSEHSIMNIQYIVVGKNIGHIYCGLGLFSKGDSV